MSNIENIKIIRKIEDINEECLSRLTEKNFNNLKKLGFKLTFETFERYAESSAFEEEDIFYVTQYKVVYWTYSEKEGIIPELKFELDEPKPEPKNSLEQYGFKNSNGYDVEILKVYENNGQKEYVGVIVLNNNIFPMKWNYEGKSLTDDLDFNLEPIEYKQRLYIKHNTEGFKPEKKFKVSWTRDMSSSLESTGWRLATNEEIENFKI